MKIVIKNSTINFESFPWDNILANGTINLTDNGITHTIANGVLSYTRVGTSTPCLSVVNNFDLTKSYKVRITISASQTDSFIFGELTTTTGADRKTFQVTTSPQTFIFNQQSILGTVCGFDFRDVQNGTTFTITEFSIGEIETA